MKPNNYIIVSIIIVVFIIVIVIRLINITPTGILEKSSWGEFEAGNSSGMVYIYSSR